MYRTKEFEEEFEEIEESVKDNQPIEESIDDEDIVEDSGSDSEDHESDDPIQEFPTRASEIEESEELGAYKTEDEIIYKSQVLFSALKGGRELPPQKEEKRTVKKMMTTIKKSRRMLERPKQMKEETKTFITMVEINGQEAVALLDSGCTMDAISPEMVQIVGLKVHQLTEQIPIQLGTKGSKSQINHGTKACIKFRTVEMNHYFDVINIDRYDVIIGMVFMKQHGIMLDFEKDQVRMRGKNLSALHESVDDYLQVHRQAMQHSKTSQNKKVLKEETK